MGGEEEMEEILQQGLRSIGSDVDTPRDVRGLLKERRVFVDRGRGGKDGGVDGHRGPLGREGAVHEGVVVPVRVRGGLEYEHAGGQGR